MTLITRRVVISSWEHKNQIYKVANNYIIKVEEIATKEAKISYGQEHPGQDFLQARSFRWSAPRASLFRSETFRAGLFLAKTFRACFFWSRT